MMPRARKPARPRNLMGVLAAARRPCRLAMTPREYRRVLVAMATGFPVTERVCGLPVLALALAGGEPVGEIARGNRQPAVGEGFAEHLLCHLVQLDEVPAEPVEVRDREEGIRMRREDSLFLIQVGRADREDR